MAGPSPSSPYGSEGSVPDVVASGGGPTPMGIHATPEAFGSQVGGAIAGAGKSVFDLAQKQQGLINETMMTNADANFAKKVGEIKGQYMSLTGLAAHAAFPQYQKDIESAFQESRAGLAPMAQHGFDMLAARTMANHMADGSSYAASQLKEANRESYSSLANAQLQQLLDPSVANNPERSQYHLDTLKYVAQAQTDEDHPGLKKDPETGVVNFDESTQDGKQAKANFQHRLDTYLTQGYVNKYDTMAKQNVFEAYDQYQKDRDGIPRAAQVHLDASFAPKIFNAHVQNGTGDALAHAEQQHADLLYNPDSSKSPIDTVLKNEGGLSPDGHAIYGIDKNAHPEEFARAQQITEEKGSQAGQDYAKQFYKTEYWDKKGVADLPPSTQTVVMDGVVNHSTEFGNKLIDAAKNGATPQELIAMRRDEYQRLATQNPTKYGENLQGWNNRLDNLQSGLAMEGNKKPYGANPDGSPLTLADYYRTHSQDVYAKGDAYAEQQMPGDLALKRAVRQSLENYMNKTISNQSAQYAMDNKFVMRGITGALNNGNAPATYAELRALPGMAEVLDRVAYQDPKFSEGIETQIARVSRKEDNVNSPNGYETILRTLETNQDHPSPNAIRNQSQLDSLLGKSDGTGINVKDYNDAKAAVELDQSFKEVLSKNMKEITNANGNLDGKGQQRALLWYNQTMDAYKKNEALGDKKDPNFIDHIGEKTGPFYTPPVPSRMTQISNWAKEATGLGNILVTNPDGQQGYIPAANLEKALKAGYKKVE